MEIKEELRDIVKSGVWQVNSSGGLIDCFEAYKVTAAMHFFEALNNPHCRIGLTCSGRTVQDKVTRTWILP